MHQNTGNVLDAGVIPIYEGYALSHAILGLDLAEDI